MEKLKGVWQGRLLFCCQIFPGDQVLSWEDLIPRPRS